MKELISMEWIKIKKLKATYFILLSFIILLPVWMYAMNEWFGEINQSLPIPLFPDTKILWSFPTVWKFVTWSASWFNYILVILIIVLTTQEFSNRTLRQHVIEGLPRQKIILSKLLTLIGISAFSAFIVFLTGLIFGISQSEEMDFYTNVHMVFLTFIQSFCYFGLAFIISILVKRAGISILIFYGYLFIEMIVGIFIPGNIYAFLPANVIAKLTPLPFFEQLLASRPDEEVGDVVVLENWENIAVALGYILIFCTFIYFRLKKRDI